jgi:hypothetical protein
MRGEWNSTNGQLGESQYPGNLMVLQNVGSSAIEGKRQMRGKKRGAIESRIPRDFEVI